MKVLQTRSTAPVALALMAVLLLAYRTVNGQPASEFIVPEVPQGATNEARIGKQILGRLVQNDVKHARDLGFTSPAEAVDANTNLGAPFPIIRVDFRKLVTFKRSSYPAALLMPTNEFFYPVTVGGAVRSSLRVKKVRPDPQTGQEWRTTVWSVSVIRLLDQAKRDAETSASNFAVWIPELNRYFLGDIKAGKVSIIPLIDEPRPDLQFKAHTALPAVEVFERLVPEAKRRTNGAG